MSTLKMNKICCVGDADICPKSSSCSMVLRSACSHKHSRESSTVREQSRVRSHSKRKLATSTKKDSSYHDLYVEPGLQSSLKQLALKSAAETYSLLNENLYNNFEVSKENYQYAYKINSLNLSCAKELHFSHLSTSDSSFDVKSNHRIECSSDYSSAAESDINSSELLNSTSSMERRHLRSSGSLRSLSGSDEDSDILIRRIRRGGENVTDVSSTVNTPIPYQGTTNSHHLFSNHHTSYNANYVTNNNHLGIYNANSGSDKSSLTDSLHLDSSDVQYSSFGKFRWFLWRCLYLKIIRNVSFDVWLLSRIQNYGKHKVIFFLLLLPLLFLLTRGMIHSDSFLSTESTALSETVGSVFSPLLMALSPVYNLFSPLGGYFTHTEEVFTDEKARPCPPASRFLSTPAEIFKYVFGRFWISEESASSTETVYDTEQDVYQSHNGKTTTEEEIKLLVTKVLKENNFFQRFDDQRTRSEMTEREKNLQTEISNLRSEFQSFKNYVKGKQNENEAVGNIIAVSDEQKKHIDLLNLKLNSIEAKLGILESLKSCCDKQLKPEAIYVSIGKHIINAFKSIVNGNGDQHSEYQFFTDWINSKFINHEKLMQEINAALKKQSSYQANVTHDSVIKIVDSAIQKHVESMKKDVTNKKASGYFSFGTDEEKIKQIVKEAIMLYDADKTGQVDYALESGGGSVLGTRCSETYVEKYGKFSVFGVPLWSNSNSPRTAIQPDVHPGRCWAFKGSQGFLVIELSATIYPTGFTMEHIPVSVSPTGTVDSAPKNFSIWGLESDKDSKGTLLGEYWYDINGDPLQFFAIEKPSEKPYSYVELQVHSNHGNIEYTCLYRFRVHGIRVR